MSFVYIQHDLSDREIAHFFSKGLRPPDISIVFTKGQPSSRRSNSTRSKSLEKERLGELRFRARRDLRARRESSRVRRKKKKRWKIDAGRSRGVRREDPRRILFGIHGGIARREIRPDGSQIRSRGAPGRAEMADSIVCVDTFGAPTR